MTRGQPGALAAVQAMVVGPAPHAVLLAGPPSTGKTTLALDLAAGLLCLDPDPARRPCRECRGCHQLTSGNHPDLHRLAPEGPGAQIKIGKATDPEPGTVRHLVGELSLHSVEGGARVAVVEAAHRMNEDAQNALLKTLEEPPSGVTIVLCADDEERLLPTVRSRCVRLRLGSVAGREIERWLDEQGAADPPRAARLARLAGGRPGLALAYARSSDAERLHGSIARAVLDLLAADRRTRLTVVRALLADAASLNASLASALAAPSMTQDAEAAPKRRRGRAAPTVQAGAEPPSAGADAEAAASPAKALAASDRRAAAVTLLEIWASVGRDLALATRGARRELREPEILDDLVAAASEVDPSAVGVFLARLAEVGCQLDENVNPELALDVLSLAWPRTKSSAAVAVPTRRAPRVTPGIGSAGSRSGGPVAP